MLLTLLNQYTACVKTYVIGAVPNLSICSQPQNSKNIAMSHVWHICLAFERVLNHIDSNHHSFVNVVMYLCAHFIMSAIRVFGYLTGQLSIYLAYVEPIWKSATNRASLISGQTIFLNIILKNNPLASMR